MMDQEAPETIWRHLSEVDFRQSWVDVDGIRTRFARAGPPSAPAVVMIHGTGSSWEAFCANLGAHARHFNCFALDLVGSGYTDKPDRDYDIAYYVEFIHGFMRALSIQKAALIGISLGAWISAQFALTHPGMVHALTLNAAFGLLPEEEGEVAAILSRRGKAFEEPTWENLRTVFAGLIHDERKRLPDLIALRQRIYRQPEMRQAGAHILSVLQAENIRANLIPARKWKEIQAPTLVTVSLNDKPLFIHTARAISQLIPAARAVEIDGAAHWPQFEQAEEFNRVNVAFLREVVP